MTDEEPLAGDDDDITVEGKAEDSRCLEMRRPLLTEQVLRLLRAVIHGHCKVRVSSCVAMPDTSLQPANPLVMGTTRMRIVSPDIK